MLKGSQVREKLTRQEDNLMKQPISRERGNVEPTEPPEWKERWTRVMRLTPSTLPVIIKHMPANGDNLQGYINKKIGWHPVEMTDLRYFKEEMMSFRMHTPYVKQKVNNWAT